MPMNPNDILFERTHPLVSKYENTWIRINQAYSGGASYLKTALIRHMAELEMAYLERLKRAYYINLPKKIARLISHFLLSSKPKRDGVDDDVQEDFDRHGLRVDEVMLQASTTLNCYGLSWLLVDMPAVVDDVDMETKKKHKLRPYCQVLSPFAVRDWAYDSDGEIAWAIISETRLDEKTPFSERERIECRRVWTRSDWRLFEKNSNGEIKETANAVHGLGRVPLVKIEEADGFGMGSGAHWFEDVVRISDAILNNGSEAQMNIIQQLFGLLVLPESFARSSGTVEITEETTEESSRETTATSTLTLAQELAKSAAIWETEQERGICRYISPGGVETKTIREENTYLKEQLFDVVGLALQSSSKSAQTAESKAWDSVNIQQGLANRAIQLEQAEAKAWELLNLWDSSIKIPTLAYNHDFSVKDIEKSVAALMNLSSFDAGDEYAREVKRAALAKLAELNQVSPETYQKVLKEINEVSNEPKLPRQRTPQDV
jgi:hypothetical protein